MKIVLEHTNDEHCNEVTDFKKHVQNNIDFALFEIDVIPVKGSNYFRVKCYDETGLLFDKPATRLDLLSQFAIKYLNRK